MSAITRGEKREKLTFVKVGSVTSNVYYGWDAKDLASETNVGAADLAALGHVAIETLTSADLYFLRAQSPKPGRAKKVINAAPGVANKATVSTFYGAGSVKNLLQAGWKVEKRPRGVSLSNNTRYITAIAELSNGTLYCFPMNRADFDTYAEPLGLKAPASITTDAERLRLVQSSGFPRPGKAGIQLPSGASFSSFFSTDKESDLRAAGFKISMSELTDE